MRYVTLLVMLSRYVSSDFIRKAILPSNPFLLSDLLCIIQCSRLRPVSIVNIICRIRIVEFICFFFLFSFFPTSWEFLPLKIKGYFAKRKYNKSKYNKMILGKTSISVTVSEKSCLNFLHMIIFRKSWELRYLSAHSFFLGRKYPAQPRAISIHSWVYTYIHVVFYADMRVSGKIVLPCSTVFPADWH